MELIIHRTTYKLIRQTNHPTPSIYILILPTNTITTIILQTSSQIFTIVPDQFNLDIPKVPPFTLTLLSSYFSTLSPIPLPWHTDNMILLHYYTLIFHWVYYSFSHLHTLLGTVADLISVQQLLHDYSKPSTILHHLYLSNESPHHSPTLIYTKITFYETQHSTNRIPAIRLSFKINTIINSNNACHL